MADALVLGTSSNGVRVRPPSPAIKNGPKLRLGVIFFYLAEKRGRTARPPAGGKQSARCNGDDRRQRRKQGGAVGAAF